MLAQEAKAVAEHQRRRFHELVDVFDRPQPPEVIARLREIVASADLRSGAVVLDVGNRSRSSNTFASVLPAFRSLGLRCGGKDVAACATQIPCGSHFPY